MDLCCTRSTLRAVCARTMQPRHKYLQIEAEEAYTGT